MKVTHIIIGLGVGGAELMLKRLVEGLNGKDGMQHSIISLTELGSVGKQLQEAGINVKALGMKNALSLPATFFKLRRELKKQKPDIVQTWMYHADFLGGLAAKSLGIHNIIWNVRNTNFGGRGKFNEFLVKACAYISNKVPSKIFYVSKSAKDTHEDAGYSLKKSQVIYNGFDIKKFNFDSNKRNEIRNELGYENTNLVVCSVGRFSQSKDHVNFIRSVKLAVKENKNIRALMVGLDIDKSNRFIVNEIGNDIFRFKLLGQRDDVYAILSAADIFCLHSITEGFPNVLGEAMSSSLACITTQAGDAALILNQPEFTVPIQDEQALSKAILKAANLNSEDRVKLGSKNRERIINEYSLDKIIEIYSTAYLSSGLK